MFREAEAEEATEDIFEATDPDLVVAVAELTPDSCDCCAVCAVCAVLVVAYEICESF